MSRIGAISKIERPLKSVMNLETLRLLKMQYKYLGDKKAEVVIDSVEISTQKRGDR